MTLTRLPKLLHLIHSLFLLLLLSACGSAPKPIAEPAPLANIYLNQLAYDLQSPKHAVIALPVGERASRFMVYQGSTIVHQGQLVASEMFTEWGQDKQYYLADFSDVKRKGTFYLVVNRTKVQLKSSTFIIKQNPYFELTAQSLLNYFKERRDTSEDDLAVRIINTEQKVDVSGGWFNSSTNNAKLLSSKNDTNLFTTQQGAMPAWALAKSYSQLSPFYDQAGLSLQIAEEVLWGADYLHRLLSPQGYFYNAVHTKPANLELEIAQERIIAGYEVNTQSFNDSFQSAYREGAGIAIAALARAFEVSRRSGVEGEYPAKQYLIDAERAFTHLQKHNLEYVDDGKENIIDDYTALIAATDLYRVTKKSKYLQAARKRAHKLNQRMSNKGWFISDNGKRPFYHSAEAGMPVLALANYLSVENSRLAQSNTRQTIKRFLEQQITLSSVVANPFDLARQTFQTVNKGNMLMRREGFFMPHQDETNYTWQGENARLASLATAGFTAGKYSHRKSNGPFGISPRLAKFSQNQLDWLLGKNPYHTSMLFGFGHTNAPYSKSAGMMIEGGMSNGVTGATLSPDGRGITWVPGPEAFNKRWVMQPIENSAWYLLAISSMTQ